MVLVSVPTGNDSMEFITGQLRRRRSLLRICVKIGTKIGKLADEPTVSAGTVG